MTGAETPRVGVDRIVLFVVFVAFVPLAFSDELVDGSLELVERLRPDTVGPAGQIFLPIVDALLLLLLLACAAIYWKKTGADRRIRKGLLFLGGVGLTVGTDILTDVLRLPLQAPGRLLLNAVAAFILVGALSLVLLAFFGDRRDFYSVVPLLAGTLVAYLGSVVWDSYRVMTPACAVSDTPCAGLIDQEYFAQLSQIIPLILIAVGLEAGFFRRNFTSPARRAVTINTVLILCLGEVMAISALPLKNEGDALLSPWHEYFAFVVTLEAVFVGIAVVIWILVSRDDTAPLQSREGFNKDREVGATSGAKVLTFRKEPKSYDLAGAALAGLVGLLVGTALRKRRRTGS